MQENNKSKNNNIPQQNTSAFEGLNATFLARHYPPQRPGYTYRSVVADPTFVNKYYGIPRDQNMLASTGEIWTDPYTGLQYEGLESQPPPPQVDRLLPKEAFSYPTRTLQVLHGNLQTKDTSKSEATLFATPTVITGKISNEDTAIIQELVRPQDREIASRQLYNHQHGMTPFDDDQERIQNGKEVPTDVVGFQYMRRFIPQAPSHRKGANEEPFFEQTRTGGADAELRPMTSPAPMEFQRVNEHEEMASQIGIAAAGLVPEAADREGEFQRLNEHEEMAKQTGIAVVGLVPGEIQRSATMDNEVRELPPQSLIFGAEFPCAVTLPTSSNLEGLNTMREIQNTGNYLFNVSLPAKSTILKADMSSRRDTEAMLFSRGRSDALFTIAQPQSIQERGIHETQKQEEQTVSMAYSQVNLTTSNRQPIIEDLRSDRTAFSKSTSKNASPFATSATLPLKQDSLPRNSNSSYASLLKKMQAMPQSLHSSMTRLGSNSRDIVQSKPARSETILAEPRNGSLKSSFGGNGLVRPATDRIRMSDRLRILDR